MSSTTVRKAHAVRTARASHRTAGARLRRRPAVVAVPLRVPAETPARASGLRVTRRGRLVVVLTLVALLFAAFSLGRTGTQAATTTEPSPAVVQTTVQPGETLWAVAKRVAPGTDPREVVQRLQRLNHLRGSGLQAGQQLLLPA
ncbi:MAG: hypothetical protein JWO60_542 [Frankiales bacterium]|nr:hypothetical protein [Frankiales bacterium]